MYACHEEEVGMCRWGEAERHCGKVGGRSNELAPHNDCPRLHTVGQGHDRCYHMRILDQMSALVAAADGGEGVGRLGVCNPGFEIYAPHGTEGPGNLLDTVSTCILHA